MMRSLRTVFLSIGAVVICCSAAYSGQMSFESRLQEKKAAPGRQVYYEIILPDGVPAPEAPFVEGIDIRYVRSYKESGAVVHTYRVIGRKPGLFTIGPVELSHGPDLYRSNPVTLEIAKAAPTSGTGDPSRKGAAADIAKHGYLVLEASKASAYVNEKVQLTLSYYSDSFCVGDISGCVIKSDDLIISDLSPEKRDKIEQHGRVYGRVQRFATFTGHTAGRFTIKPVTMQADIIDYENSEMLAIIDNDGNLQNKLASIRKLKDVTGSATLYEQLVDQTKKRPVRLSTEPLPVNVMPLPEKGRPEDFSGAVGNFSFDLSASAAETKLYGEIILNMTIKGPGNYSTVFMPSIKKTKGMKLYEPRVVKGDDSVTYEMTVRIQSPDVNGTPEAVFSFFDPDAGRYISIKKGPLPLSIKGVEAGAGALAKGSESQEERKEWAAGLKYAAYPLEGRRAPFYRNKRLTIFEALPILIVLIALAVRGLIDYLKAHPFYTASLIASRRVRRAIVKAESMIDRDPPDEFYGFIFRVLQEYLGTRRLRPSGGVTSNIIDELDTTGLEKGVVDSIRDMFHQCYIAKYTKEAFGRDDMKRALESLEYVVDNLNRKAEI